MRKMILIFVILLISLRLLAPCVEVLYCHIEDPLNIYDPLIAAIIMVESAGNVYAYNSDERACGPMQIRPVRIEHYNRLTGKDYNTWDVFDLSVSREIFMHFTRGRDFETVAKSWNGSGSMTIEYWNKVKARL